MNPPVTAEDRERLAAIEAQHGELPERIAQYPVYYQMTDGARCCRYCAMVDGDVEAFRPNYARLTACERCGEPLTPITTATLTPRRAPSLEQLLRGQRGSLLDEENSP